MDKSRAPFYCSCLVLVAALLRWPTWTFPFRSLGADNYWSIDVLATNILTFSFVVFPILAFIGFLRGWRFSYLWLGLSPLVFFLFGSVPIPFAGYFYGENHEFNTAFIATINIVAVLAVIWLYRSEKARSNNALKRDGEKRRPLA